MALLGGLLNYGLEKRFDELGVIEQYDVLFNADAVAYLGAFANGWSGYGYKHPNVANFTNPGIRASAKAASFLSGGLLTELQLRRELALVVVPASGVLKTLLLFLLFANLGLKPFDVTVLCVIELLTTSRLVFGSVPESFPLSAAVLAWLLCLGAEADRNHGHIHRWLWIVSGAVAFGITITNIVPFGIVLFLVCLKHGKPVASALKTSLLLSLVAVGISTFFALGMLKVYSRSLNQVIQKARSDPQYHLQPREAQGRLLFAMADTFAGPQPTIVPNVGYWNRSPIKILFTYEGLHRSSTWIVVGLTVWAFLLAGTAGHCMNNRSNPLFWASIGIILFYFATLSLYTRATYLILFSQHWVIPALFLLCGVLFLPGRASRIGRTLLLLFGLLLIVTNALLLSFLFTVLSG